MKLPTGIRQRGESLIVDVTVAGKRYTRTVNSLDVSEAKATRFALETEARQALVDLGKGWTLQTAMDKAEVMVWRDCKSKKKLLQTAQMAVDYFGGTTLIKDITVNRVDEWIVALTKKGNNNATINRKTTALSRMLSFAVERLALPTMPHIEYLKESKGRERYLSPEEEVTILATMRGMGEAEHANASMVLIDTGMRGSELWGMHSKQVDMEAGLLKLPETKVAESRIIPMTQRVKAVMEGRTGLVFPYGNPWMQKIWDKVKRTMDLTHDGEFVPYTMRHTFGTRLLQRGVPLPVIMRLMGHKNPKTTLRYAKNSPGNLADAIKVLE